MYKAINCGSFTTDTGFFLNDCPEIKKPLIFYRGFLIYDVIPYTYSVRKTIRVGCKKSANFAKIYLFHFYLIRIA